MACLNPFTVNRAAILIAFVMAMAAAPPAFAQGRAEPSIERSQAAIATDAAASRVQAARATAESAAAKKQALQKTYQRQLAAIDALKRQRPSWRRDGEIRDQLAASLATARRLTAVDAHLREVGRRLAPLRAALVRAADHELSGPLSATRRALVSQLRAAAARALRPPPDKIVLPDTQIDPLADPEDLEYQAELIREAERQLSREAKKLARREARFSHMAKLTRTRARANQLEALDDHGPRRRTGRVSSGGQRNDLGDSTEPAPGSPGGGDLPPSESPTGDPGFDPIIVLSDVVDPGTLDALRAAIRSSDPAIKAAAARRTRAAVTRRIENLERRRQIILKRARTLSQ